jgi:hypothetical protein
MKYFMAVWCILWSFGIFFPALVSCTKKNLATLLCMLPETVLFAANVFGEQGDRMSLCKNIAQKCSPIRGPML